MHTLCGASRSVGAQALADLARRIEYADVALGTSKPAALASQLDEALNSVEALINARLDAAAMARRSLEPALETQENAFPSASTRVQ